MLEYKNKTVNVVLGIISFIMLSISFFFYPAHIDNYIFYSFTNCNLGSILEYCVHYGNGRILGNFICALLSHFFWLSPFFISGTIVLMATLLNRIIFNSSSNTFLLTVLLLVFKESRKEELVYNNTPAFINYVFPCLLLVLSVYLFKVAETQRPVLRKIFIILACVITIMSALFSENTSIIFMLAGIFQVIYCKFIIKHKMRNSILYLCSIVVGNLIMFAIPHLFNVNNKLDGYRNFSTLSPAVLLNKAVHIVDIVTDYWPVFFVISVVLITYMLFVSDKKFNLWHSLILIVVPFVFLDIKLTADTSNAFVRILISAVACIYVLDIIVTLISYFGKNLLFVSLTLGTLVVADMGIMLFVNPYSHRLFYVGYFGLIIWVLCILNEILASRNSRLQIEKNRINSKQTIIALLVVSVFFTSTIFLNNIDVFNEYIYPLTSQNEQANMDLNDPTIYFNKFAFAIRNYKYGHPQYGGFHYSDKINGVLL